LSLSNLREHPPCATSPRFSCASLLATSAIVRRNFVATCLDVLLPCFRSGWVKTAEINEGSISERTGLCFLPVHLNYPMFAQTWLSLQ
jgi:hypothetical protein